MSATAASLRRIHATPYARRLARERGLPLSTIAGSGPEGRITGDDLLKRHAPPVGALAAAARAEIAAQFPAREAAVTAVSAPCAIVAQVDFTALDTLLAQITALRAGVSREDICLKAAAVALRGATSFGPRGTILLLTAPDQRRHLAGLAEASVGGIATLRGRAEASGDAALAVSFIGRSGIRPVAAQLVGGTAARLVVGAPDGRGRADCLMSYDTAKLGDGDAEDYLAAFRDLVEAPFRLLV
jgi:hypothetical protein